MTDDVTSIITAVIVAAASIVAAVLASMPQWSAVRRIERLTDLVHRLDTGTHARHLLAEFRDAEVEQYVKARPQIRRAARYMVVELIVTAVIALGILVAKWFGGDPGTHASEATVTTLWVLVIISAIAALCTFVVLTLAEYSHTAEVLGLNGRKSHRGSRL
jgi:hypothetical protein